MKRRVLVVHNEYQQPGGEDTVVQAEVALLREHGHEVVEYRRHNDEIEGDSRAAVALQTLWSTRTVREVETLIERERPDVIHAHNTFPLVSPSLYWTAQRLGVPVVQTLHNFRLVCPQGILLRDGRICTDCVGRLPWRGVVHRCYRGSLAQSAVLTGMLGLHRLLGTYADKVTLYVTLNEFCRAQFEQAGLPAERLRVKPNFLSDPQPRLDLPRAGGLFVGRLGREKGAHVLLEALRSPGAEAVAVEMIGGGDLQAEASAQLGERFLGRRPLDAILQAMQRAAFLVVPSICIESFPRTIVEAYACGLPVIASRLGPLASLVEEGRTGLLFEPGDAQDLLRKLQWATAHPEQMLGMGRAARAEYVSRYTAQRNLDALLAIYDEAVGRVTAAAEPALR